MFLAKVDVFGYSLQPTFRGKSKFNTVLGGVVTLFLVALFTFGFFFLGREIVEKKNPISNVSAVRVDTASIPLKDVPISFAVVSNDGRFLHLEPSFTRSASIKGLLYEVGTTENGQFSFSLYSVPMVMCTEELMGSENFEAAKSMQEGTDFAFCPDHKNIVGIDGSKYPNETPSLKNPYGSQNSAYLDIYLEACDESADPGCRQAIEAEGSFNFVATHPEGILNISDNSNPLSMGIKSIGTTAFLGLSFRQLVHFNTNELISDEGWILEQKDTQTFLNADPSVYNATQFSEADRIIGRFLFGVNLTKNITSRRYMKLQELVANLGGFIKISMLTFSFLLKNYAKWSLYLQLSRVETRVTTANPTSSGIMMNNMVTSQIQASPVKMRAPTFFEFVRASLSERQAKKMRINWGESIKHLDLLYIKKQFEELDLLLKRNNLNK